MSNFLKLGLFLVTGAVLSGCGTIANGYTGVGELTRTPFGQGSKVTKQEAMVDLAGLIDPSVKAGPMGSPEYEADRLAAAQYWFEVDNKAEIVGVDGKVARGFGSYRRDEIQSQLIEAANQRCIAWRNFVFGNRAGVGFNLATTANVLSAAASAFTPEGTIRGLAAASTAASGANAEFDKNFYSQMTSQVILQGIEAARSDILIKIAERRALPLRDYTLRTAVADAVEYHAACSIHMGLVKASEKVEKADFGTQGLDRTEGMLKKLGYSLVIEKTAGKKEAEPPKNGQAPKPAEDGGEVPAIPPSAPVAPVTTKGGE